MTTVKPPVFGIRPAGDDLQAAEDRVADPQRLGPGVHRHGVLRRARDAEVVGRDPVADDQIVEADPKAVAADHLALIMIDADDLRAAEPHAVVPGREVAQRVRHVAGVEAAGRHLIEQRLEGVVRELVEQGNPKALFG